MRPVCQICSKGSTKTGRWPLLGDEISGYRQCPSCSRWWSDDGKNRVVDKDGNDVQNPFNFSLAKSQGDGDPNDPSNPGGYIALKVCNICKNSLPLSDFYPHSISKDGLRNLCKECFNRNRDRLRQLKRQYPDWEQDSMYNKKIYEIHQSVGITPAQVRAVIELWQQYK